MQRLVGKRTHRGHQQIVTRVQTRLAMLGHRRMSTALDGEFNARRQRRDLVVDLNHGAGNVLQPLARPNDKIAPLDAR